MEKRAFFVHLTIIVLSVALFNYTLTGLKQLYRKDIFLRESKNLAAEDFKAAKIEYAFVIERLGFLEPELSYNAQKRFPAASLIKLPILAAAFYAVKEKKIFLEKLVTIQKKDVAGGSGKLKSFRLPIKFTFAQLLELMISSSDNTAANKVIKILGFDYINNVFKKLGLAGTTLVRKMMDFSQRKKGIENYTSAADISYLLEKIYGGGLVNRKLSKLALTFLKKQKVNDRLPRYLPKGVVVAHKTGLERGVVHDAGIIFTSNGDYIICVLVKGGKGYAPAKKFIAQVSLLAYNLLVIKN